MSKLYTLYQNLKKKNPKTIYLFKSGIFFVALDQDAKYLSDTFNFKLTNLNQEILKCGFPCSSFEKYNKLFKICNLDFNIIDKDNTLYTLKEYSQSQEISNIFNFINSIDISTLSIEEAYSFIENLKSKVENLSNN